MQRSLSLSLSSAEGVAGPVQTLMGTAVSPSPSSVSPAAGPGAPNVACSLASAACSTSAAVIGLSSSVLASLDDDFEGLDATKNSQSAAADHVELFPVIFGYPTAILREVHAHRILSPSWTPTTRSVVSRPIRHDLFNLRVIAHLSHSVLFHFRS